MKSQKIEKPEPQKEVLITNQNGDIIEQHVPDHPPARIIYYVEMAGMDKAQQTNLIARIRAEYRSNLQDKYYVIPVHDRKISTDIVFEDEILAMVNDLCEVKDGQITLRDGYKSVNVIREYVQ